MKNAVTLIKRIALIGFLGSIFISCQEDQLTFNDTIVIEQNTVQSTSGNIPPEYLMGLIDEIEDMVADGVLNNGNGNALISKINNAINTIDKGNTKAVIGQLGAFINEVEALVENGTFAVEQGHSLINVAENGIILSNGSFVDERDGHEYSVVLIGDQLWMAENLAYLPSISGSDVNSNIDPYYYIYGYNGTNISEAKATENYVRFGVLYNWEAAKTSCPNGWHLPSDEEWKTLMIQLGMNPSDIDLGWSESGAVGKKLKSTSSWLYDSNGDNSSGFNALPAGCLYYMNSTETPNEFRYLNEMGFFWSSSPWLSTHGWSRLLFYDDGVYRLRRLREEGFSVRCLKD